MRLLAAITFLAFFASWVTVGPAALAQQPDAEKVADKPAAFETLDDVEASSRNFQDPAPSGFDSSAVAAGEAAFSRSCLTCHDAERALAKSKSLGAWRATVARMAAKRDANIPAGNIEPIAMYLASRGGTAASGQALEEKGGGDDSSLSIYGTFGPLWRGGNDNLENPGFFPDTWIGASWQSATPISGRATACITCHNEPGQGSRVELVEGSLQYDLSDAFSCCFNRDVKSAVEAGRFIVPFGAFAAQSNPGVYRTVTKPLIYDMGQRVHKNEIGDPVLPMPYADEGAAFNLTIEVGASHNAGLDVYVVNGLQGNFTGVNFFQSRDYVDNNPQPAVGGRVTLGNQTFRLGSSLMSGQFSPTAVGGPIAGDLFYRIWGFDAVYRYENLVRVQFEFARRDNDHVAFLPTPSRVREHVAGYFLETEFYFLPEYNLSFLARYDWQHRDSSSPPIGSGLGLGTFGVARFTYGFNFTLAGGSLLMINHERWWLPGNLETTDVLGIRWAATF